MKRRIVVLLILCVIAFGSIEIRNIRYSSEQIADVPNHTGLNSSESSLAPFDSESGDHISCNQEEPSLDGYTMTTCSETSNEDVWERPPDRYAYGDDSFWGMRGEYLPPVLKEIELSKEEEAAARAFFESNPTLAERIWEKSKVSAIVYLMDVTGDDVLEVLIHYYTDGARDLFSGRLEVYDLESGRFLGNIWKDGSLIEGMGWYKNEEDDTTEFYVMDMFFYDTLDETYISGSLRQAAYVFSRIEYEGSLITVPLWLYNVTIQYTPLEQGGDKLFHYSLLDFTADDLVSFINGPTRYYYVLRERWTEGCDSVIRDSISHIQPIETLYKEYAYIDGDGLHITA